MGLGLGLGLGLGMEPGAPNQPATTAAAAGKTGPCIGEEWSRRAATATSDAWYREYRSASPMHTWLGWGIGALEHWGIGALGRWGIGASGHRDIGALVHWYIGVLGHWDIGALGHWRMHTQPPSPWL